MPSQLEGSTFNVTVVELSSFFFSFFFFFLFLRQSFSVVLKPVLELALVDQAGLELTEIHLSLPP